MSLFVDSTVTTPYLVQPPELDADVVIHSTSKMINGGGNLVRLRSKMFKNFENCPAPYHPGFSAIYFYSNETEKLNVSITEDLVRISVGIENIED